MQQEVRQQGRTTALMYDRRYSCLPADGSSHAPIVRDLVASPRWPFSAVKRWPTSPRTMHRPARARPPGARRISKTTGYSTPVPPQAMHSPSRSRGRQTVQPWLYPGGSLCTSPVPSQCLHLPVPPQSLQVAMCLPLRKLCRISWESQPNPKQRSSAGSRKPWSYRAHKLGGPDVHKSCTCAHQSLASGRRTPKRPLRLQ
jgi:hypothetical protein